MDMSMVKSKFKKPGSSRCRRLTQKGSKSLQYRCCTLIKQTISRTKKLLFHGPTAEKQQVVLRQTKPAKFELEESALEVIFSPRDSSKKMLFTKISSTRNSYFLVGAILIHYHQNSTQSIGTRTFQIDGELMGITFSFGFQLGCIVVVNTQHSKHNCQERRSTDPAGVPGVLNYNWWSVVRDKPRTAK